MAIAIQGFIDPNQTIYDMRKTHTVLITASGGSEAQMDAIMKINTPPSAGYGAIKFPQQIAITNVVETALPARLNFVAKLAPGMWEVGFEPDSPTGKRTQAWHKGLNLFAVTINDVDHTPPQWIAATLATAIC